MSGSPSSISRFRAPCVAALVASGLLVALTWPLFRHPATTVLSTPSLYGDAGVLIQRDINLTMWILAWDTHALTTDPLRLFHANAFHPAPYSLALSEHMLGNLPIFGPVFFLTGNPVLAHQLTLLVTFAIAAATMAAYVEHRTRDAASAVAAGILFALAPARLWQLGNLHVISVHLLPAVLLCVDQIVEGRRTWAAGGALFATLTISSLCSYYVGYQTFLTAALYALVGLVASGKPTLRLLGRLGAPTVAAAIVVALVTLPYLMLQRSDALPDYESRGYTSLAFFAIFKFGVTGLLEFFVRPLRDGIPQYLTLTGMLLGLMGLRREHRSARVGLLLVGVTGAVLSLGPIYPAGPGEQPYALPYDWLARVIPGFSSMRAPQRFGVLTTLAVCALAGFGIASLRVALLRRRRGGLALLLPLLVVATTVLEVTPGRITARRQDTRGTLPPAIRWLAMHGDGGPVLHLPIAKVDQHRESLAMYYSIFTWLPLANGYSSYPPRTYVALADAASRLPDPSALPDVLSISQARWVVFDRRYLPADQQHAWHRILSSTLLVAFEHGAVTVFRVPARVP